MTTKSNVDIAKFPVDVEGILELPPPTKNPFEADGIFETNPGEIRLSDKTISVEIPGKILITSKARSGDRVRARLTGSNNAGGAPVYAVSTLSRVK